MILIILHHNNVVIGLYSVIWLTLTHTFIYSLGPKYNWWFSSGKQHWCVIWFHLSSSIRLKKYYCLENKVWIIIHFWTHELNNVTDYLKFCSEKQQVSKNGRLQVYVNQSDCVMSILAWRLPRCYRISEHFFNQFYITDAHALISNICVWINSFSFCIDLNFCG